MQNYQKRLKLLIEKLDTQQRQTLLDFAEFLSSKSQSSPDTKIEEPVIQARPDEESVVKAIRRLSNSYPMLDKSRLLNQTSMLMSQHMMQGKEAIEIIDQLEAFFADQYQLYLTEKQG